MKRILLATTALLAFAAPAAAWEFSMSGARAEGSIVYNSDTWGQWTGIRGGGSVAYDLAPSTAFQLDVVGNGYGGLGQYGVDVIGHLGFDLGDTATVGVFAGPGFWNLGDSSFTAGAEIAGDLAPFHFEAFGAFVYQLAGFWSETHLDAKVFYDLTDRVSLGAGGHAMFGSFATDYYQGSLFARYGCGDGLFAQAGYTYTNNTWSGPTHAVGLRLTKVFGAQPSFSSRDYINITNGY